jgi:hypothetical protein
MPSADPDYFLARTTLWSLASQKVLDEAVV